MTEWIIVGVLGGIVLYLCYATWDHAMYISSLHDTCRHNIKSIQHIGELIELLERKVK